jgi:hypothetical protein
LIERERVRGERARGSVASSLSPLSSLLSPRSSLFSPLSSLLSPLSSLWVTAALISEPPSRFYIGFFYIG